MHKSEELVNLKKECLNCKKCSIGGQMINGKIGNVFSNMSFKGDVLVVGQNPGLNETEQGQPFVGQSGKFFDESIAEHLDMKRHEFYISNVAKCFTPGNRKPTDEEIENCRYFLDKEIEIVKPKIIITLGAPAFKLLTGLDSIMKDHGRPIKSERYNIDIFGMLHPSPLNMNSEEKRNIFYDDLRTLKRILFKFSVVEALESGINGNVS